MSGSLLLQGVALGFVEFLVGGKPWVCVSLQEELSGSQVFLVSLHPVCVGHLCTPASQLNVLQKKWKK